MKYFLVCFALCLSTLSKAQILCDYERGPSLTEVKNIVSSKYSFADARRRYAPANDYTVTVINLQTDVKSSVIYLKDEKFPEFILEYVLYSSLPSFINSLYAIGFKQVSSDTWIRANGDVMVLHDNRNKSDAAFFHEVLAFFSLHGS